MDVIRSDLKLELGHFQLFQGIKIFLWHDFITEHDKMLIK